ncbi:hypothetical protein CEUSTIGMA_g12730.t1 [Chlamydomonas eustigma]|uniref:Uncharacterized protein n=1 Tax=Chlamydomonas eustigma TaxID=1157962 RepID=A0A250XQL3_9CHLO|nr:hypothetical protein CEUSTIGMA_g12730.t1 [Chlamydomonas eustigma]|eukprot:GAX85313.1 hypothetical protein CEUSTIGMA_g12730.t1 [Chlamydomonas eustigma]
MENEKTICILLGALCCPLWLSWMPTWTVYCGAVLPLGLRGQAYRWGLMKNESIVKTHPGSELVNMTDFKFNDAYAKHHIPPIPLPVPREFSVVLLNGWGARPFIEIQQPLAHVRRRDILIINLGSHYSRALTFQA